MFYLILRCFGKTGCYKADSATRYYHELKEVCAKFAAEKKALENVLRDSLLG